MSGPKTSLDKWLNFSKDCLQFARKLRLRSSMNLIQAGLYRHFKGANYIVLGTAQHSESDEIVVVYAPEQDRETLWVRPIEKFIEKVSTTGGEVQRFTWVGNA